MLPEILINFYMKTHIHAGSMWNIHGSIRMLYGLLKILPGAI